MTPDAGDDDAGNFELAPENSPGDVYAAMGKEYMKWGQFEVALRKLQTGLTLDPENPRLHAVLGLLYDKLGSPEQAEKYYVSSIELDPHNSEFRNFWGNFLCQRGEYSKAMIEFNTALSNPLYAEPWIARTNLGLCALRAGQRVDGERNLRLALSANPNIAPALFAIAQLQLERRDYASAQEYLLRHEKIVGKTPQNLLLQCKTALGLGNKTVATNIKNELIARYPDTSETQIARGLVSP